MYPHITFQSHDCERGKLWRLIKNAEVGQACGLTGSIQPRWLMARFLFHLVHWWRIICQDQDCETKSLRSFKSCISIASNPALDLFGSLYHLRLFIQIYSQYDCNTVWIKLSVGSNWLIGKISSFYFVPGLSLRNIGNANTNSQNWVKNAAPPTSNAWPCWLIGQVWPRLWNRSLWFSKVAFLLKSNSALDLFWNFVSF